MGAEWPRLGDGPGSREQPDLREHDQGRPEGRPDGLARHAVERLVRRRRQGIYPTASEIERGVSMEYFTADGTNEFQIDAGIEIQGGTSDDRWKMDKLSMRVKFTDPYGPEKLDANVYTNGVLDEGAATNFNTFILDAHLGYTWAYGGPVRLHPTA